jgi:hypothetical protein
MDFLTVRKKNLGTMAGTRVLCTQGSHLVSCLSTLYDLKVHRDLHHYTYLGSSPLYLPRIYYILLPHLTFTLHDHLYAQLCPCHAVSPLSFGVWLSLIPRCQHPACILPRPTASPFTPIPHYPSLSRREDMDPTSSWVLALLCESAGPVCLNCCLSTLLPPIHPHPT